jgi:hypothetical protein
LVLFCFEKPLTLYSLINKLEKGIMAIEKTNHLTKKGNYMNPFNSMAREFSIEVKILI